MQTATLAALLALAAPAVEPPEKYAAAAAAARALVRAELAVKGIPSLSVAVVSDQQVLWAEGFGHADRANTKPATADTVYRVGSVSKLFTDVAVMQLAEAGALDIDAPVTKVLPDFAPAEWYGKPVTLRHLMAHRSGLVREPPLGSYFDASPPPLAGTVASLKDTKLLFEPGSRVKYSNAGIAAVGLAMERSQGRPFAGLVRDKVLRPLGMADSDFAPRPDLVARRAEAVMWTYHGREFPAPTFELGEAPAGCMDSTVHDLAAFAEVLFAGGRLPGGGRLLKEDTIKQMFTPQFAAKDARSGIGLGFLVGELDGRRRVGHNGAIYGFATELALLPDEKLAAVAVCSKDVANAVTLRVADEALRLFLAARDGLPQPEVERTEPLPAAEARALAGRYRCGDKELDVEEYHGRAWVTPSRGGQRVELRKLGRRLVADDVLAWGPRAEAGDGTLRVGGDLYERVPDAKPPPCPERWRDLVGEYGPDHNVLYVLERGGRLHALIEWVFLYPLAEEGDDAFAFPDAGLYPLEKVTFRRDKAGRVVAAVAAGVVFPRRPLPGEGRPFRVEPRRPVAELRREADAAEPPAEKGTFREPDLVDLAALDPTIKLDVRYATADNFLGTPVYTSARAFLQRPAAEALVRAHKALAAEGYGLTVFDGYRPWRVTKVFWEATPVGLHKFVADPAVGSRHNRGCAVDLTLHDRATGRAVAMPGGYDEFSDRAYPLYPGGTSLERWHRVRLRRALEAEGFRGYDAEWWHFDHADWRHYRLGNRPFEALGR